MNCSHARLKSGLYHSQSEAEQRNLVLTAPYFHDGKIKTLDEAVRKMGKLQLDEELTDQQVSDIASFLKALTDKNSEQ
jgi:cytochrome c peroxidase